MGRPVGVTILSGVMMAAGAAFAVAGLGFFFAGSTGAAAAARSHVGTAALVAALGAASGVMFLLFGALQVVLAVGIFKLHNLSRVCTILLFMLIGAGACLGLIATLLGFSPAGIAWNASLLVVDAVVLWYLLQPSTKKAFTA
jgi:hypothetical protein